MNRSSHGSAPDFYSTGKWAEADWIETVAVEYRTLLEAYPFQHTLERLASEGQVRLLDIGCGTGIFPAMLDEALNTQVRIVSDLLDRSPTSLAVCAKKLGTLSHFQTGVTFDLDIEHIPQVLAPERHQYQLIWALHSLTTVDLARMKEVFSHLARMLDEDGRLLIYQLGESSSYQQLHSYYRRHHRPAGDTPRFMQAEDSLRILDELGLPHQYNALSFEHVVPAKSKSRLLEGYLRKCVLDEQLEAVAFFKPLLASFADDAGGYRFPQTVYLIEAGPKWGGT